MRDRLGRLHCGTCGLFVSRMTMEYPEGDEEQYICISCFSDGSETWIPVEVAELEYPDWGKRWREEIKKQRERMKERFK